MSSCKWFHKHNWRYVSDLDSEYLWQCTNCKEIGIGVLQSPANKKPALLPSGNLAPKPSDFDG